MSGKIYSLTDGAYTNNCLEFVSTYFPYIAEPLTVKYRGRTYRVLSTKPQKIEFEDFFISHDCIKCTVNCCKQMYIPIGFEEYWPEEKLKTIRRFKPRRYKLYFNDRKLIYYIGVTGNKCKFQEKKACTIWDSNNSTQVRPMGCHFYPMTFYVWEGALIFTKHCADYMCKGESNRYTQQDFNRDLNTFEKLCKEVEAIGFEVNYDPVDALKEQCYFSI